MSKIKKFIKFCFKATAIILLLLAAFIGYHSIDSDPPDLSEFNQPVLQLKDSENLAMKLNNVEKDLESVREFESWNWSVKLPLDRKAFVEEKSEEMERLSGLKSISYFLPQKLGELKLGPEYKNLRNYYQLYRYEMFSELLKSKEEIQVEKLFKFTLLLDQKRFYVNSLFSKIIKDTVYKDYFRDLAFMLEFRDWKEEDLLLIYSFLTKQIPDDQELVEVLRYEMKDNLESLGHKQLKALFEQLNSFDDRAVYRACSKMLEYNYFYQKNTTLQSLVDMHDSFSQGINDNYSSLNLAVIQPRPEVFEELYKPNSVGRIVVSLLMKSSFRSTVERHYEGKVMLELLKASVLAKIFEKRQGKRINTLEDLKKIDASFLAKDYLAGCSLVFDREKRVVYSLGVDGSDDKAKWKQYSSGFKEELQESELSDGNEAWCKILLSYDDFLTSGFMTRISPDFAIQL